MYKHRERLEGFDVSEILTRRLVAGDTELAIGAFAMMAAVFEEGGPPLSRGYVDRLLAREGFWAFVAVAGGEIVGGLTAHALPMTRDERTEMFIYDVAVRPDYQRQGVGRHLMAAVRVAARGRGIDDVFVAADEDDAHALDFYRSLGGSPSMSAIFTFPAEGR
jgi:aminoglycoside 3-N-acetyltransferase I